MELEKETSSPPVEIPMGSLSAEALQGVIDNFIQREGTDYGATEVAYETKIRQIHKQLENGDIKIVYDPNTETVSVITAREWQRYQSSQRT